MNEQKLKQIPLRLVLILPFVLQIVGAVGLVGYLSDRGLKTAKSKRPDIKFRWFNPNCQSSPF